MSCARQKSMLNLIGSDSIVISFTFTPSDHNIAVKQRCINASKYLQDNVRQKKKKNSTSNLINFFRSVEKKLTV